MSESQSRSEPTIFWVENRIGICTAVGYYIAPDILTVPVTPPSPKPKEDLHSLKKLIQTSGPSLALATRSPTEKAALRPKKTTITRWKKVYNLSDPNILLPSYWQEASSSSMESLSVEEVFTSNYYPKSWRKKLSHFIVWWIERIDLLCQGNHMRRRECSLSESFSTARCTINKWSHQCLGGSVYMR